MRIRLFALLLVLGMALSGCTSALQGSGSTEAPQGATATASESDFYYYFFDDIVVPREMKLDTKDSMVFGNGKQKSGVMAFTGRVEFISLTNAFIRNMRNDGWKLRFQFSSPRTLLLFTKPEKFCVVNITDGSTSTDLEIWVSPRPDGEEISDEKPMNFFASPAPEKKSVPVTDAPVKEESIKE